MEEQSLPPETKKKVITLFGKKINVATSPSSPLLELFSDTAPPSISTPLTPTTDQHNTIDAPESPSSNESVLKLRLHLLEQKVKQLTEANEKLSAQLTSVTHHCEDLELERDDIKTKLTGEREKVMILERANDAIAYKLELLEKMYAETNHHPHSSSSYSPPTIHPALPHVWGSLDGVYSPEGDRRRRYDSRYDDRVPLEYGDERPRERDRKREREREKDRDRDRERERERDIEIDREPLMYPPDYNPFPADFLHLPSPPPPPPRGNVFNRLGSSATDMPHLPSPPSPLEEGEHIEETMPTIDRAEKERVLALEARLDLPLDALTKKNKSEKKAQTKNQKRPLCKYYFEQGLCKNRGSCKFSHSIPNKRAKLDI